MKKFQDEQFNSLIGLGGLIESLEKENLRQLALWGIQKHTLPEWMLFLTEEIGELAEAIAEYTYREGLLSDIYKEAIETATLALKIAEMIKAQGDLES